LLQRSWWFYFENSRVFSQRFRWSMHVKRSVFCSSGEWRCRLRCSDATLWLVWRGLFSFSFLLAVCILDVFLDIMLLQRLGVICIILILIYSLYQKTIFFGDFFLPLVSRMGWCPCDWYFDKTILTVFSLLGNMEPLYQVNAYKTLQRCLIAKESNSFQTALCSFKWTWFGLSWIYYNNNINNNYCVRHVGHWLIFMQALEFVTEISNPPVCSIIFCNFKNS
jgi:hypothetical protein